MTALLFRRHISAMMGAVAVLCAGCSTEIGNPMEGLCRTFDECDHYQECSAEGYCVLSAHPCDTNEACDDGEYCHAQGICLPTTPRIDGDDTDATDDATDVADHDTSGDTADPVGDEQTDVLVDDDPGDGADSEDAASAPCIGLVIEPVEVDFGQAPLGVPVSQSFDVSAQGDCSVQELALIADGDGAFTLSYVPSLPLILLDGKRMQMDVQCMAESPAFTFGDQIDGEVRIAWLNASGNRVQQGVPIYATIREAAPACIELQPQEGIESIPGFPAAGPGLDFGVVALNTSVNRDMVIRNCGDLPLTITSIATGVVFPPCGGILGTVCPEFTFSPELPLTDPAVLAAGEEYRVAVTFSPTVLNTPQTWFLVVQSNAATAIPTPTGASTAMSMQFGLKGMGSEKGVRVMPSSLDLGRVTLDCCGEVYTTTVHLAGSMPVTLSKVALGGDSAEGFELLDPPQTPYTIDVASTLSLSVRFCAPADAANGQMFYGSVELEEEGGTLTAIPVSGAATRSSTQQDAFTRPSKEPVDILWVMDCSGSMTEEQQLLADNAAAFIDGATTWNLDLVTGVTSCDMESTGHKGLLQGNPKLVRYGGAGGLSRTDAIAAFKNNINLGTACSADELGLAASVSALSPPLITDAAANLGLLRSNARLVVVFISDEEDHSSLGTDFYADFLHSLKGAGAEELVSVYAIVGNNPSGCSSGNGDAYAGARYIEVAERCNGSFFSICAADWSPFITALNSDVFAGRRRYHLSRPADPATLVVKVNGTVLATSAWSFDAAANILTLNQAPAANSTLTVDYEAQCR